MRIKLDEDLGERGRQLFAAAGHEVATAGDQGLAGAVDRRVLEVCGAERRCLVTLDLDFSNPFVFPPEQYAGHPHNVPAWWRTASASRARDGLDRSR